MADFLKLEWWNECDLGDIYYLGGFRNKLYLDTEILKPEYTLDQKTKDNNQGVDIVLSQVRVKIYQFEVYVPEYIVDALVDMALHDNIRITYTNGLYSSSIRNVQVIPSWEDMSNDCMATVVVKFQQDDQIIDTSCCIPLNVLGCLVPCLDVIEFLGQETQNFVVGGYYIESQTSPQIVQYVGNDTFINVACENNYVRRQGNNYFGIEMYFSNGQWYEAPEITNISEIDTVNGLLVTILGFALPNTFVQLYSSTDNINFTPILAPITADEFFNTGFTLLFFPAPEVYLYYYKVYMYNHNCQYQYSEVESISS